MKNKGFTLIELLAVIVILAIIALIATPIIINIIENARGESEKRSIELYASAVKNAIAAEQLKGNIVTSIEDIDMEKYYDGDVACATSIIGKNGNVYLKDCTVNGNKVDYTYGSHFNTVCTLISGTELTAGAKYSCQVNETTSYNFYVLTTPSNEATTVNLIMDRNICEDGTAATETNTCLYVWITKEDYITSGGSQTDWDNYENMNIYGPITAMTKLDAATSSWTNLKEMEVSTFTDNKGNTYEMAQTFTTYARLPYLSEVSDYSRSLNNEYLYDNMDVLCLDIIDGDWKEVSCDVATIIENGVHKYGMSHIRYIYDYLTLSFHTDFPDSAWLVQNYGHVLNGDFGGGIRPVITLSI